MRFSSAVIRPPANFALQQESDCADLGQMNILALIDF